MNKSWLLAGALALALAPVFAGGEECSDCCDGDVACCGPEKAFAKVNEAFEAAAKAHAEALNTKNAMPAAKVKEIEAAREVLMANCPATQAWVASFKGTAKMLALATRIDKLTGAAETPRGKVTAKLAATYMELCKSMGCGEKECGDIDPKDTAKLAKGAAQALKEAEAIEARLAGVPDQLAAVTPEVVEKVKAAFETMRECPTCRAMEPTMKAILAGFRFVGATEAPAVEDSMQELAAARDRLLSAAAKLAQSSCGGSCEKEAECGDAPAETAAAKPPAQSS
jgi:hypothetical protein